ncbi:MAG: hypothetical protein ACI82F_002231 [Planctomycetota bacterium]
MIYKQTEILMQRTFVLALLALPLLSAVRPEDSYDLTPRFEEGQSYLTNTTIAGTYELDEASVLMNGFDMLEGGAALDGSFGFENTQTEEVLELRDGKVSKLRRTIDAEDFEYAVEFDVMGESNSDEGSESGALVGRTLEISVDEDGEVSVLDVTDGDLEPADSDALAEHDLEGMGGQETLPDEPVEIGDSWDIATDKDEMFAVFREGVMEGAEGDANSADIAAVVDILLSNSSLEATGTLVDVEGKVAQIEWSITAEMIVDDLTEILLAIADPEEIGEIPAGVNSNFSVQLSIEAAGSFDLTLHQLTEVKATIEFSMEAGAAFSEDEMELDAGALLSGTFELVHTTELL